jgi:hypothetical protein
MANSSSDCPLEPIGLGRAHCPVTARDVQTSLITSRSDQRSRTSDLASRMGDVMSRLLTANMSALGMYEPASTERGAAAAHDTAGHGSARSGLLSGVVTPQAAKLPVKPETGCRQTGDKRGLTSRLHQLGPFLERPQRPPLSSWTSTSSIPRTHTVRRSASG